MSMLPLKMDQNLFLGVRNHPYSSFNWVTIDYDQIKIIHLGFQNGPKTVFRAV